MRFAGSTRHICIWRARIIFGERYNSKQGSSHSVAKKLRRPTADRSPSLLCRAFLLLRAIATSTHTSPRPRDGTASFAGGTSTTYTCAARNTYGARRFQRTLAFFLGSRPSHRLRQTSQRLRPTSHRPQISHRLRPDRSSRCLSHRLRLDRSSRWLLLTRPQPRNLALSLVLSVSEKLPRLGLFTRGGRSHRGRWVIDSKT